MLVAFGVKFTPKSEATLSQKVALSLGVDANTKRALASNLLIPRYLLTSTTLLTNKKQQGTWTQQQQEAFNPSATTLRDSQSAVLSQALKYRPSAYRPGGPLTEFTLFPKLPIELRIIIWGFETPEPAYVTQVMSKSKSIKRRLHYIHSVPAVLQVCQESRNKFLAAAPKDQSLQRQQRGHPVYKIYSSGGRTRNETGRGFYMSAEVDTFWGMEREDIRKVSVARELKHLAIRYQSASLEIFKRLFAKLPELETLTVLLPISRIIVTHSFPKFTLEPEIDGELNPLTFNQNNSGLDYIHSLQLNAMGNIEELKKRYPKLNVPVIKWRFEEQAIEVENIIFPEAPKNPYEEIDQEEEAIEKQCEKQRKKAKKDNKKKALLSESTDVV